MQSVIDDASAARVAAELMTLDATGDQALVLQLQGVERGYGPAFSLMDTIDLLGVPVLARCTGVVGRRRRRDRRGVASPLGDGALLVSSR